MLGVLRTAFQKQDHTGLALNPSCALESPAMSFLKVPATFLEQLSQNL